MRRHLTPLLLMLAAFMMGATHSWAKLDEYKFVATTGERIFSKKAPQVEFVYGATPSDDGASDPIDIGFDFYFDGSAYTQFSVASNGVIGLGDGHLTSCWVNDLTAPAGDCPGNGDDVYDYSLKATPYIVPFWDDLTVYNGSNVFGSVTYSVLGKAGSRTLIIDFNGVETWYGFAETSTWQVRLYEGSNKIEFFYEFLNPTYKGDGATIGIANGESNFLSVTPNKGGSATASSEKPDNAYNPNNIVIPEGTLYIFDPCGIVGTGDLSHDESKTLRNGDTLLLGKNAPLGGSADFTPVSLDLSGPNPCLGGKQYTIYIEGDGYSVDQTEGKINGGEPLVPVITFAPTDIGQSVGIITIVDEMGGKTYYYLAAEGGTRLQFVGNIDQGGTEKMADGDELMGNLHVRRGQSQGFTPFTIINTGKDPKAPPASVSFTFRGLSKGQYAVDADRVDIASGEKFTPTITFSPTGIGHTHEVLVVNAEGQEIIYNLNAFSDGVGGQFIVASNPLGNGSQVFTNQISCSGSGNVSLPVEVSNIGNLPFQVSKLDVYRTDTVYKQGQPTYPLVRDAANQLIPASDYFLSAELPVPPFTNSRLSLPITLQPGEKRTIYLTFLSQQPGKRFARAFLYSNDETVTGVNPAGQNVQGLRTFDLFGRGAGAQLGGSASGGRISSVVFASTDVGVTGTATRSVFNNGTCDLLIAPNDLRITGGDVEDFSIISTPTPDSTGNIVIKPGQSAEFTFGFTPVQAGSRRATLRMRTNDSTVQVPGITERGVYYLNLFGGGASGLYLNDINFGQVLIGGDAAEQHKDVVRLVNSNATPLKITDIALSGADAGEFKADPAKPWPATPFFLQPGEERELSVVFAPATGGMPGDRSASISIITSLGTNATALFSGSAGTRTIEVNPPSLTFAAMTGGKFQRRIVTISNNGTMPVHIVQPEVTGPDALSFQVATMPRLDIEPGGQEFLEVTYLSGAPGTVTAALTIAGNATNAPLLITLNGTSFITKGRDNLGDVALPGRGTPQSGIGMGDNLSTSSVGTESVMGGVKLSQSIPNPGREIVEISYSLASTGQMELSLYDATGRLVKVLDAGERGSGSHSVRVDVRDLSAGAYHYRLTSAGGTVTRTLQIVR